MAGAHFSSEHPVTRAHQPRVAGATVLESAAPLQQATVLTVLHLFPGSDLLLGIRVKDTPTALGGEAYSWHRAGPRPWALGPPMEAAQRTDSAQPLESRRPRLPQPLCPSSCPLGSPALRLRASVFLPIKWRHDITYVFHSL